MKLVPKRDQMLGRLLITKLDSAIIAPDATRGVSKMILVQAVGAGAAAEGYKVGDLVVPRQIGTAPLRAGTRNAFFCDSKDVLFTVEGATADDFLDGDGRTDIVSLDPGHPSNAAVAP